MGEYRNVSNIGFMFHFRRGPHGFNYAHGIKLPTQKSCGVSRSTKTQAKTIDPFGYCSFLGMALGGKTEDEYSTRLRNDREEERMGGAGKVQPGIELFCLRATALWSPYCGFPVGRRGEWAVTAVGCQAYQGLMNVSCFTLFPINLRAVYLPPILYTR